MRLLRFKANVLMLLVLLGMTSWLGGCSSLSTTRTAAIEADQAIASDVCSVWLVTSYSRRDTEETQLGNRANNAARDAYCGATGNDPQ